MGKCFKQMLALGLALLTSMTCMSTRIYAEESEEEPEYTAEMITEEEEIIPAEEGDEENVIVISEEEEPEEIEGAETEFIPEEVIPEESEEPAEMMTQEEEPEETPEDNEPDPDLPMVAAGESIRAATDKRINGIPMTYGGNVCVNGIRWNVIGATDTTWLLLSYPTLGNKDFTWEGAKNYCSTVYDGFSSIEKSAVIRTTKIEDDPKSSVNDAALFLLSYDEVLYYLPRYGDRKPDVDGTGRYRSWWTRTFTTITGLHGEVYECAYAFYTDGAEGAGRLDFAAFAARPAFQFDRTGILFSFADEGDKASGFEGGGDFGEIITATVNGVRLTMLDKEADSPRKNFKATVNAANRIRIAPGGSLTINYSGAAEGDHISALICQNGKKLYYATTEQNSDGKWTATIPDTLSKGSYTLMVFSEQQNGDLQTDYASPVTEITLDVPSFWELLQEAFNAGGIVELNRDITAAQDESALVVPEGKEVILRLNGHTLNRGLSEAKENGNIITNNGTLTIEGNGTLTGAYNTGSGGAITNNRTLTIKGGTFTGNTAKEAGAVYNNENKKLIVEGGEFISNTVTTFGGGAFVNYGTMTFTGGTVSNNTVPGNGGGIWTRGILTVTGGTITGNTAGGVGGGINLNGGTLRMAGSLVVTGNYAGSGPSDVYMAGTRKIDIIGPLDKDARIGILHASMPSFDNIIVITNGLEGNGTEANFVSDNDSVVLFRDYRGEIVLLPFGSVTVDQDYLALGTGETGIIDVTLVPEGGAGKLVWKAVDKDGYETDLISIDEDGTVTAGSEPGTAWAVAQVMMQNGEVVAEARCRVDVIQNKGEEEHFAEGTFSGIRLPETKASVELYKTSYTKIRILPEFTQNNVMINASAPGTENGGAAIEQAGFVDQDAEDRFYLHVVDDRTLEIIPTEDAINGVLTVGKTYSSAIRLLIDGQWTDTQNQLTFTVKKSLPKIKAKAITLNSYESGADVQQIVFTGGTVVPGGVSLDTAKPLPDWLTYSGSPVSVTYTGPEKTAQKKTNLYLKVKPEGWAVEQSTAVAVSAKSTGPAITFKTKTLTLKPGTNDRASTTYTIKPALYSGAEVTFSRIMEKKVTYENDTVLNVSAADGEVSVTAPVTDGKAHTYTVYLSVQGKESSFKVKTLADSKFPVLKLTAKGTIDLTVNKSPAVITAKLTNMRTEQAKYSLLKIVKKDDPTEKNIQYLFNVSSRVNVYTITAKDTAETGVYTAVLEADCGNGVKLEKTANFTVKQSAAPPNVTVALKASGKIDVLRPRTSVTLKPTVKNSYDYTLSPGDITVTKTYDGKTKKKVNEDVTDHFLITLIDGNYVIRLAVQDALTHTDKYTVKASVAGVSSKAVTLKVVQGKASVKLNTKEITLLKTDCYSRASAEVVLSDPELSGIAYIELVSPKDKTGREYCVIAEENNLLWVYPQNGSFVIGYNENLLPKDIANLKTKTLKVRVFLLGNMTDKPNATLTLKISFK
ncbi:MAG: hypothetical protein Q4D24_07645 [Erysipelotrichaceae bacterium]|nr:hypothetical protein [Erysipelotrichaceae bacterium]